MPCKVVISIPQAPDFNQQYGQLILWSQQTVINTLKYVFKISLQFYQQEDNLMACLKASLLWKKEYLACIL